jgi:hypothetical protein
MTLKLGFVVLLRTTQRTTPRKRRKAAAINTPNRSRLAIWTLRIEIHRTVKRDGGERRSSQLASYRACVKAPHHRHIGGALDNGAAVGEESHPVRIMPRSFLFSECRREPREFTLAGPSELDCGIVKARSSSRTLAENHHTGGTQPPEPDLAGCANRPVLT